MSRFTTEKINKINPYVPGEQPIDKKYIKLNTNENPYFTAKFSTDKIDLEVLQNLNRYSDPECLRLTKTIAEYYGVEAQNVLVTNGSDEALAFAFMSYCTSGVCYPDVTYGFYDVIARLCDCPIEHIPLNENFKIPAEDFKNKGKSIVIANPNAQTGIELAQNKLELIIKSNSENVVIIDQAYADFGKCNAIELTKKYDNLIVINTFSKSRSLAGARVGYVIADKRLIDDLKKVKNSFHPYNVNSISSLLAEGAINDDEYFKSTVKLIIEGRERLAAGLKELNFELLPSAANFVLAKHECMGGEELYLKLKENGILVRHFNEQRIKDYIRITVGTKQDIENLLQEIKQILAENDNENG